MRTLGIPTIEDRVAQMVVLQTIEPYIEPLFHEDSCGCRPNKSALDAAATARQRCWKLRYVIEPDIKGLSGNIDHDLLMKAAEMHGKEKWAVLYIRRWLTAPFIDHDGKETPRTSGTPQGGVISPILANLFMHYAFDMWMARNHPEAPFERYADDALIHCGTREEAESIKAELAKRFAECRLEMNEDKTRIACCKSMMNRNEEPITEFDFPGYTFTSTYQKCRDGKCRLSFGPRVSKRAGKSFREKIKALKLHHKVGKTLEEIAEILNPYVRGWVNYFGRFCPSAAKGTFLCIEERILRWARRKYKTLRGHRAKSRKWLEGIRKQHPDLFVHWKYLAE